MYESKLLFAGQLIPLNGNVLVDVKITLTLIDESYLIFSWGMGSATIFSLPSSSVSIHPLKVHIQRRSRISSTLVKPVPKLHLAFRIKMDSSTKIRQKVSFYIASKASYVYILSGQKFIKNAKNG